MSRAMAWASVGLAGAPGREADDDDRVIVARVSPPPRKVVY